MAVVMSRTNRAPVYAIFADVGPRLQIGEGSLALAKALGFRQEQSSPRHGGVANGIQYLVFPGSGLGQGKLRTLDEITRTSSALYDKWGSEKRLQACSPSAAVLRDGAPRALRSESSLLRTPPQLSAASVLPPSYRCTREPPRSPSSRSDPDKTPGESHARESDAE